MYCKSDCLGCAVFVCLTLLASFFLPSHLSLKQVQHIVHVYARMRKQCKCIRPKKPVIFKEKQTDSKQHPAAGALLTQLLYTCTEKAEFFTDGVNGDHLYERDREED